MEMIIHFFFGCLVGWCMKTAWSAWELARAWQRLHEAKRAWTLSVLRGGWRSSR
jgi:hypothetical protein